MTMCGQTLKKKVVVGEDRKTFLTNMKVYSSQVDTFLSGHSLEWTQF